MPQLHFYVPQEIAERIRKEANAAGLSVSQYLADVVKRELPSRWPVGFFEEVVGAWKGDPLERFDEGTHDVRDPIEFGDS